MAQGQLSIGANSLLKPAVVAAPPARVGLFESEAWQAFVTGIWADNPIFRQILGICSALAVTNKANNTLAMGLALTFVTGFSCLLVSLLRTITPRRVRMVTQILIIAVFVIIVDLFLKAYFFGISKEIGPFVGLIITNCLIMGRCENFASNNKPMISLLDGIGCGLGYAFLLMCVAVVREPLGTGKLFNISILGSGWTEWGIMVAPPGAFFVLGVFIWIMRGLSKDLK